MRIKSILSVTKPSMSAAMFSTTHHYCLAVVLPQGSKAAPHGRDPWYRRRQEVEELGPARTQPRASSSGGPGWPETSGAERTDMSAYLVCPGVTAVELMHSQGKNLFLPD